MLRKNIRQRKEFLYHKEQESKNKEESNKRLRLKQAIDSKATRMPTELLKEEERLRKGLELTDANTILARTHIDDEYNTDMYIEPKVVITTSRHPSQRLTQFQKEFNLLVPNSLRFNRGAYKLKEQVEMAERKEVTDFILQHEHRGEPDGMIISHLPLGPTIYLGVSNVVLRHDLQTKADTMSEAYPHLIFDNFSKPLGERIQKILTSLFPVPKMGSKRVISFGNKKDIISFRYHFYFIKKTSYL